MRLAALWLSLAWSVTTTVAAEPERGRLEEILARAGERVERYFARAQNLVCLELVRLLPLNSSWGSDGVGRTIESELRLSWKPDEDGAPTTEAQTLRQLLRVNGHQPRAKDSKNCTEPEQQTVEPQPLSLLLDKQRADYQFRLAGQGRIDGRQSLLVDYKLITPVSVESHLIEGRDDCVSFDVQGGREGRLWIDADSFDVLRLDERLSGMVEIPLPKPATRGGHLPRSWTLERMDTSIRFKPVAFSNPDETLVLPVSLSSMRVTRGSGTPRLRTMTEYKKYQRFITGGRIVGQ